VNGRAKGLPQDGAHAGGQTYDSSKRRETTSNHQTTSDHDQRLRVPCRMFLLPSMLAHFMRLMGAEAQAGPGFSRAQQNESRLAAPRGSSLRNLPDRLPLGPRGGRRHRSLSGARDGCRAAQRMSIHSDCRSRSIPPGGIVQLKQHFRSRARTTFLEHLQRSAAAMS